MLNTILDDADEEERHLEFSDDEYAHQGLLLVVLSVIHMNNGCVKQEALFEFLKKQDSSGIRFFSKSPFDLFQSHIRLQSDSMEFSFSSAHGSHHGQLTLLDFSLLLLVSRRAGGACLVLIL